MRRFTASVVLCAGLAATAILPASSALADTTVTVGQTGPPINWVWFGGWEHADPSSAIPAYGGTVTSFQFQSGTACAPGYYQGTFDFQVLRPEGNNQYLVVGDAGNQTDPCDGQTHTYPANIAVQGGDVLGVYVVSEWMGGLNGSGSYVAYVPEPAVGQTVTFQGVSPHNYVDDESATLVPSAQLISDLGSNPTVQSGPGTSLSGKIQQAEADLAAGDVTDACATLTAFDNQVNAQAGKQLTAAQASQLIAEAKQIQSALGCPGA
jgi:hypothetical protein